MAKIAVNGARSVSIGVSDLPASVKFYTDVWKLSVAAEQGGTVYLRATGADHHVLALQQRAVPALLSLDLSAPDRSTVDALHAAVRKANIADIQAPAPIREPGGGYGFGFKDPEGRILRIIAEDARHQDAAVVVDRPLKLSHIVLNSRDRAGTTEFYNRVLGFRLIDSTKAMNFLCCNSDHHSIAFADSDAATLNHIAFDMKDYDSVMRGAGRMRDHGYGIEWGWGAMARVTTCSRISSVPTTRSSSTRRKSSRSTRTIKCAAPSSGLGRRAVSIIGASPSVPPTA